MKCLLFCYLLPTYVYSYLITRFKAKSKTIIFVIQVSDVYFTFVYRIKYAFLMWTGRWQCIIHMNTTSLRTVSNRLATSGLELLIFREVPLWQLAIADRLHYHSAGPSPALPGRTRHLSPSCKIKRTWSSHHLITITKPNSVICCWRPIGGVRGAERAGHWGAGTCTVTSSE